MKLFKPVLACGLLSLLAFSSCKKKEQAVSPPTPGNEFLTTVKWHFVNVSNPADTAWAVFRDSTVLSKPYKDALKPIAYLKAGATYSLTVHIYDETQTPVLDITPEIIQRENYHLYFFFPSAALGSNFVVTAQDHDTNNPPLPVGLTNKCVTGTACSGSCEGVLRHQPNAKNGTYAPGSTDSDVHMTIIIQ